MRAVYAAVVTPWQSCCATLPRMLSTYITQIYLTVLPLLFLLLLTYVNNNRMPSGYAGDIYKAQLFHDFIPELVRRGNLPAGVPIYIPNSPVLLEQVCGCVCVDASDMGCVCACVRHGVCWCMRQTWDVWVCCVGVCAACSLTGVSVPLRATACICGVACGCCWGALLITC